MEHVWIRTHCGIDKGNHKMNDQDKDIVISNRLEDFFHLSPAACSYTKNTMIKYTEFLWQKTLDNIYLSNGQYTVPIPTVKPISIPLNISRKLEVLLMSMFYENNLMNDFLWKRSLTESPLCPHCKQELQTPYHALLLCNGIDQARRQEVKIALIKTLGEDDANSECCTTLLNASRSSKFMEACVKILQSYPFRQDIQLNYSQDDE